MRELKIEEITEVSGCGVIADIASAIGGALGGLADSALSIFGVTTSFGSSSSTLWTGLGQLLEFNFSDAKTNIIDGISEIFSSIVSVFS